MAGAADLNWLEGHSVPQKILPNIENVGSWPREASDRVTEPARMPCRESWSL